MTGDMMSSEKYESGDGDRGDGLGVSELSVDGRTVRAALASSLLRQRRDVTPSTSSDDEDAETATSSDSEDEESSVGPATPAPASAGPMSDFDAKRTAIRVLQILLPFFLMHFIGKKNFEESMEMGDPDAVDYSDLRQNTPDLSKEWDFLLDETDSQEGYGPAYDPEWLEEAPEGDRPPMRAAASMKVIKYVDPAFDAANIDQLNIDFDDDDKENNNGERREKKGKVAHPGYNLTADVKLMNGSLEDSKGPTDQAISKLDEPQGAETRPHAPPDLGQGDIVPEKIENKPQRPLEVR